jgi:hypothetical protein
MFWVNPEVSDISSKVRQKETRMETMNPANARNTSHYSCKHVSPASIHERATPRLQTIKAVGKLEQSAT